MNEEHFKVDISNVMLRHIGGVLICCLLIVCAGCKGLAPLDGTGPLGTDKLARSANPWSSSEPSGDVTLAGGVETDAAVEPNAGTRLVNFVTGNAPNPTKGKELYQQGDAIFRTAGQKSKTEAVSEYYSASKLFHKAGSAAPGSALEQDALFMKAESLFFANRLTEATKAYEKLQKDFPRNRHSDRVAARLFSISRYWIDAARAGDASWFKLNLTNSKLPAYDAQGHAIRVLDQIRYDDPTGRLADDATMAAAAEYIRQEDYERADEFLTDLRETFTDSDHMFLAHVLGIRCKMQIYRGAVYSGLVLEEAEELIRKTRLRFPDKLSEPKYGEMIARAASEIAYHQAERFANRANYRENRKEYGAARQEYRKLLKNYPNTPQAKTARSRLAAIETFPAAPTQKLAFLSEIFTESQKSAPLETIESRTKSPSGGPASPSNGTILR